MVPTRSEWVAGRLQQSIIDHCYNCDNGSIRNITLEDLGNSDHNCVKFSKMTNKPMEQITPQKRRNYVKMDIGLFLHEINDLQLDDEIPQIEDPNKAAETLTRKIVEAIDKHAPITNVKTHKNFNPLISENTQKMIATGNKMKRSAKNNEDYEEDKKSEKV